MSSSNSNSHSVTTRVDAVRPSLARKRLRRRLQLFVSSRRFIRYGLVTLNVLLFAGIAWFTLGPTHSGQPLGRQGVVSATDDDTATEPLDQLSSADIAKQAALAAGMSEELTVAVINQADTVRSELSIAPADTSVLAKPQLVSTPFKSRRDIREYVVVEGDTVSNIAAKFGVTSDSIIWSNGLRGNQVAAGITLVIPPINGIVYTVAAGDTLESLARKYRADRDLLVAFNDIELTGLKVGERILIPNGVQPYTSRFFGYGLNWGSSNGYIPGFCTWYVANKRAAAGNPLPTNLGNAVTWYSIARSNGMPTGYEPRAGAVLWHTDTWIAGGLGHVGYVERVNPDGSIFVSDMNFLGGRYSISTRTVPASEIGNYRFIY